MSTFETILFTVLGVIAITGLALGLSLFEDQRELRRLTKSARDVARDAESRARIAAITADSALRTRTTGGATKEDIVRLETAITNLTALLCDEEAPG